MKRTTTSEEWIDRDPGDEDQEALDASAAKARPVMDRMRTDARAGRVWA